MELGDWLVRIKLHQAGWSACLLLLSSLAPQKSRRRFLLAPAHPGSPGKRAVNQLCVCVYNVCRYASLKCSDWHALMSDQIVYFWHQHIYPHMEWAILPLLPSHIALTHCGWYSFPSLLRVGGWVGLGGSVKYWGGKSKVTQNMVGTKCIMFSKPI